MKYICTLAALVCLFHTGLKSQNTDPMLKKYAAYNLWANEAMTAWLSKATEEAMAKNIESSFSSLRETALHIWSAEYLWLKVLQNEPYDENPAKNFSGSSAELISAWLRTSEALKDYVHQLLPEALDAPPAGSSKSELTVAEIIQHTINHGTYHRGQLITMGRQAGLDSPPRTDFVHYVRQK